MQISLGHLLIESEFRHMFPDSHAPYVLVFGASLLAAALDIECLRIRLLALRQCYRKALGRIYPHIERTIFGLGYTVGQRGIRIGTCHGEYRVIVVSAVGCNFLLAAAQFRLGYCLAGYNPRHCNLGEVCRSVSRRTETYKLRSFLECVGIICRCQLSNIGGSARNRTCCRILGVGTVYVYFLARFQTLDLD